MDVTIVIPLYNPDKKILKEIGGAIKRQEYGGRINVIKVEGKGGLSAQLNYGIRKAKTEIVVSLHQDCVPASDDWLKNLIEPFKESKVVATVSKVELPKEFWEKFDLLAKIMSAKEQRVITPLMDEKGCAYRKSAMEKIGFFEEEKFKTAGEDFDAWIKLKKIGEIAYPDVKILHYHEYSSGKNKKDYIFKNRFKKELQISNGFGALVRIYGREMPNWFVGIIKSIPILGWPIFLIKFPYKKLGVKSLLWIPISLVVNIIYCRGFWKGFFEGRQSV
ncbi:MAG: glycosyltransferase [Candidatus Pacearchaeota archaeon]|jgi:GT2 family glycosyltransferase